MTDLLGFWRAKRQDRFAPARADIDPSEIRHLLPWIFMLDVLPGPGEPEFRYRLVGTSVDILHGRPVTGLTIRQAWPEDTAESSLLLLRTVVRDRTPVQGLWRIRYPSVRLRMDTLALPLSSDGRTVDMILGCAIYRPDGSPGAQAEIALPGEAEAGRIETDLQIFPLDP